MEVGRFSSQNPQPLDPLEIEAFSHHVPIRGSEVRPVRRAAPERTDAGEFGQAEALRQALERTPDIRPEAVERGRALVETRNYPPPEALDRLARLLAIGLGGATPGSGGTPGNAGV